MHCHTTYIRTYVHSPTHSAGPVVVTDEECLSFGNIECGTSATALLHISNQSNVPAVFQVELRHKAHVTHMYAYAHMYTQYTHTHTCSIIVVCVNQCMQEVSAFDVVVPCSSSTTHLALM